MNHLPSPGPGFPRILLKWHLAVRGAVAYFAAPREARGPRNVAPTNVRCWGQTGKHVLDLSLSGFDVVDGARSRHRSAIGWFVGTNHMRGAVHMQITTIGLDIAKNVFQVHGI